MCQINPNPRCVCVSFRVWAMRAMSLCVRVLCIPIFFWKNGPFFSSFMLLYAPFFCQLLQSLFDYRRHSPLWPLGCLAPLFGNDEMVGWLNAIGAFPNRIHYIGIQYAIYWTYQGRWPLPQGRWGRPCACAGSARWRSLSPAPVYQLDDNQRFWKGTDWWIIKFWWMNIHPQGILATSLEFVILTYFRILLFASCYLHIFLTG